VLLMASAGLICEFEACRKPVIGPDFGKRIEVHRIGGQPVAFGEGMPAGRLDAADGPLLAVYHSKHWYASLKRDMMLAARDADRSEQPGASDWRDQETLDVEDVSGLGRRAGGAGTAPG
jgi:hypothetical protein